MISSASRGQGRRPSRVAVGPSFITPPSASWWSWQCCMKVLPSDAHTSSTRRIIAGLAMPSPSSLNATAPASAIAAIGASCSPLRPTVAAATTNTRALAASRAACCTKRTVVVVSIVGFVLGMQQTVVNPPAMAEAVPVLIVSFASPPGSRRWTWGSIRPGATILPPQSMRGVPWGTSIDPPGATRAMRPSATSTSPSRSMPCEASRIRPRERSRRVLTGPRPRPRPAPPRGRRARPGAGSPRRR